MVIEQKLLIQNGEWDYLIVLDACRYDYFENKINEFFQGDLIETISSGSCTIDWCKKTFNTKNFQNTVYISSNPYINSKKEVLGFQASKIYKEVIDVWLYGWDDDLGTVFPSKITEAAQKALKNNPEKMIIHYLQPHAPYLNDIYRTIKYDEPLLEINRFLDIIYDRNSRISFIQMVASKISPKIKAKLKSFYQYYLQLIGKPPYSALDDVRRRFGVEGLRDAYNLNLLLVLEEVYKLYNLILEHNAEARVIITSDHGEVLGERLEYGHICGSNNDILLKVPWFKVKEIQNNKNKL